MKDNGTVAECVTADEQVEMAEGGATLEASRQPVGRDPIGLDGDDDPEAEAAFDAALKRGPRR